MEIEWGTQNIIATIAIVVTLILAVIAGIWKIIDYISNSKKKKKDLSIELRPFLDFSLKKEGIIISGTIMSSEHPNGNLSIPRLKLDCTVELTNIGKDICHLCGILSGNKCTGSDYLRKSFKESKLLQIEEFKSFFKDVYILPEELIKYKISSPIHFSENSNEQILHILVLCKNSLGNLYDFYYTIKLHDLPDCFKQIGLEKIPVINFKKNKKETDDSEFNPNSIIPHVQIKVDHSEQEDNTSWERYSQKELNKIERTIKKQKRKQEKDKINYPEAEPSRYSKEFALQIL